MNNQYSFTDYFLALPIWLKAGIVLAVFLFVLWPLIRLIIRPIISWILFGIKWAFRFIYVLVSWTLLSFLHVKFGGIFILIDNEFTYIMETVDNFLEKIRNSINLNIYTKTRIAIYFILVVSLLIPDILTLGDESILNVPQDTYLSIESKLFGFSDTYTVIPKTIGVFNEPGEEKNIGVLHNGNVVNATLKTKIKKEEIWLEIKWGQGSKAWILKKDVSSIS